MRDVAIVIDLCDRAGMSLADQAEAELKKAMDSRKNHELVNSRDEASGTEDLHSEAFSHKPVERAGKNTK